jgi:ATP-dependent helicase HrpA
VAALLDDLVLAVLTDVVDAHPLPRTEAAYDALLADARRDLDARVRAALQDTLRVLAAWREAERALSGRAELATLAAMTDLQGQLARLVHDGFLGEAGAARLREYPRYLQAMRVRRERLDADPARDRALMDQVRDVQDAYLHQVGALPPGRPPGANLREVRWLLEELRVSLFAQQLGTRGKVSDQRIRRALGR